MSKLTFDLECPIDNLDRRLLISAHQAYDEQELIKDITPIFYFVDPRMNCIGRRLHNLFNGDAAKEDSPEWIFSGSDSSGVPHRIGINVPPRFLDKLIRELKKAGYDVN